MKRALLALLFAALLVVPATAQGATPVAYPEPVRGLLGQWIEEAEALGANSTNASWYPLAAEYLQKAKDAEAQGRLRTGMFHLETYHEIVLGQRLLDEANATATSDADRRQAILDRTNPLRTEGKDDFAAFRADLHALDGQLKSVQSNELALYAADIALTGALAARTYEALVRELPKQQGVPTPYVYALVRASHGFSLDVGFARDLLDAATRLEGLPPRILDEPWSNTTQIALSPVDPEGLPGYTKDHEEVAGDARANNETLLAIALTLSEQRAARAANIHVIYGDAQGRVGTVLQDAARNMGKQLDNLSIERAHEHGLLGIFTADAIDRGVLAQEYAAAGLADLGIIVTAWANLDHQGYANAILAEASPVKPPEPTKETPLGFALPLVTLVLVGLARRR